jgi:hypothetical protein
VKSKIYRTAFRRDETDPAKSDVKEEGFVNELAVEKI